MRRLCRQAWSGRPGGGTGAVSAPRPPRRPDDALLAGLEQPDDAAVYRVSDDLAIIGTLDFFPPLVDDPRTFGEIAAANALSDVFAMGGRVLFALSIAAFPEDLPRDVMTEIFAGASSKVREAGGTLAGGHTIKDPEPKYGLAVVGAAHPDKLLRKGGARPGDRLVLTKRLGTGILVSGSRQGKTSESGPRGRDRRHAPAQPGGRRRSGRDGLHGRHRRHRLRPARTRARDGTRIRNAVRLRGQAPSRALGRALDLAAAGVETGGAAHNRRFVAPALEVGANVTADLVTIAHDPQTSGGLLAAVAPGDVAAVDAALDAAGVERWWIGRVDPGEPGVALV